MSRFVLSLSQTSSLKGVALIALLVHHLFYLRTGKYDDIHLIGNYYLFNQIGLICKFCVALFVFLSGYGLTVVADKVGTVHYSSFYVRRFTKLMSNYWLIWLLFVPIGVYFLGRSFPDVYAGHSIGLCLLVDLAGLSRALGLPSYNATWWFYSCIIMLYLLFPFIYRIMRRSVWNVYLLLVISIVIVRYPWTFLQPIQCYLLPFVLGMLFYNRLIFRLLPTPPPIRCYRILLRCIEGHARKGEKFMWVLFLFCTLTIRNFVPYSMLFDTVVCVAIYLVYINIEWGKRCNQVLAFLGKHSFNIFLFHTFIYYFYWPELIFWSRNPLIIFVTLLCVCLFVSIAIENIKHKLGFYRLEQLIIEKIN